MVLPALVVAGRLGPEARSGPKGGLPGCGNRAVSTTPAVAGLLTRTTV